MPWNGASAAAAASSVHWTTVSPDHIISRFVPSSMRFHCIGCSHAKTATHKVELDHGTGLIPRSMSVTGTAVLWAFAMKTLFLISILAFGCTSSDKDDVSTDSGVQSPESPRDDTGDVVDDTGEAPRELSLSLSIDPECSVCVLAEIDQGETGPITLLVGEEGTSLAPWVKIDAEPEATIPVLELRADTRYTVQVQDNDEDRLSEPMTIQTGSLPDDLPPIHLTTRTDAPTQPGLTVAAIVPQTFDRNYLVVINEDGDVVWYRRLEGMNFSLHVDDQQRIYVTDTATRGMRIDPFGGIDTVWDMDDYDLDTVHHELRNTDDGGVAFLSSEHAVVSGWEVPGIETPLTFDIISDIFTVLDSEGHIAWTWALLDHFNPLDHFTDDLHLNFWMMPPYDDIEAPKDWSHGNAMVPNGASWLGSFRNLDWLIQVNPDTDEIDWILGDGGDFELADGGMWFSRQHSPQVLPDGNILMYDNGGDRPGRDPEAQPFTRVVEYSLDEEAGIATEEWSWADDSPYFCPIVGDVDRLENTNHLVTDGAIFWGTVTDEETPRPHFSSRIREIQGTETPEVIWEVEIGHPDDLTKPGWITYRGIRIKSLYPAAVHP